MVASDIMSKIPNSRTKHETITSFNRGIVPLAMEHEDEVRLSDLESSSSNSDFTDEPNPFY